MSAEHSGPPALGAPVIAVVTDNHDPDNLGRVRLRFPALGASVQSAWARVATPMAGPERGLQCIPEVGDEVLVVFVHGDPAVPVVVGSLYSGADPPPVPNRDGGNNTRVFVSRAGHRITFDDGEGRESIRVQDHDGTLEIRLDSVKRTLHLKSKGDLHITADGELRLDGKDVRISASAQLEARGTGGTSITSGADLCLEGTASVAVRAPSVDLGS